MSTKIRDDGDRRMQRVEELMQRQEEMVNETKMAINDMKKVQEVFMRNIKDTVKRLSKTVGNARSIAGVEASSEMESPMRDTPFHKRLDHAAIRLQAADIMERADLTRLARETEPQEEAKGAETKITEEVCTACRQIGEGLLFCDACEESMALYHNSCLQRRESSPTCMCPDCWDASGKPTESREGQDGNVAKDGQTWEEMEDTEDAMEGKEEEDEKRTKANEETTDNNSGSGNSSMSESESLGYSPTYKRALPRREKKLPNLSNSTKMKTSPAVTRAGKKRMDAFDTSDEGSKEE
jgi:hypothetical protein